MSEKNQNENTRIHNINITGIFLRIKIRSLLLKNKIHQN